MAVVKKIPAKPKQINTEQNAPLTKRKVAAYARVSTDRDEQFTSYSAQVDYYTQYIQSRKDWQLVGVYTDEGISGTSTKHREGFNKMIADALAGKIDLIVTKSVSRFARNTVDSLTTIRKLKEHGTECYFEKENIWTFDGKGELLITIMSSLAQEESRSISENVTWGHRKRMADGRVLIAFSTFMGYRRGKNGEMVVDEEQAKVVCDIYRWYLQGATPHSIAKRLMGMGVPNCYGKDKWYDSTVQSILTNEKYKGDALMQKRYTEDFLTKKRRKNNGVLPQYYVEGDHEAIIEPETFDMVQREVARRRSNNRQHNGKDLLGSCIFCGLCGRQFGPKTWHSNSANRRKIYRCNGMYVERRKQGVQSEHAETNEQNHARKCASPHLYVEEIKQMFVDVINELLARMHGEVYGFWMSLDFDYNISELEAECDRLALEVKMLAGQLDEAIRENAHVTPDQTEHDERYSELTQRYTDAKARYDTVLEDISKKKIGKQMRSEIAEEMNRMPGPIEEFDEELWNVLVDRVTVYSLEDIRCRFKDGTELSMKLDATVGVARRDALRKAKIGKPMGNGKASVLSDTRSKSIGKIKAAGRTKTNEKGEAAEKSKSIGKDEPRKSHENQI